MSIGIELTDPERAMSVAVARADSVPWVDDPATGAQYKLFHVDCYSGLWVVRSLFSPATIVQRHLHSGPVCAMTLSGSWGYPELRTTCSAGDYLVEEAGVVHSLSVTGDKPADIMFMITGSITYFDGEDRVSRIEDWRSVSLEYLAGCRATGRVPAVIGLPPSLSASSSAPVIGDDL